MFFETEERRTQDVFFLSQDGYALSQLVMITEYRVRWKHAGPEHYIWVPKNSLPEKLVKEFHHRH